jgi:hypothetical protein
MGSILIFGSWGIAAYLGAHGYSWYSVFIPAFIQSFGSLVGNIENGNATNWKCPPSRNPIPYFIEIFLASMIMPTTLIILLVCFWIGSLFK